MDLPAANKFDPPAFQNAKASALPLVTLCEEPRATGRVLVGALRGMASPVVSDKVRFEYIDFELAAGGALAHTWDEALTPPPPPPLPLVLSGHAASLAPY